MPFNDPLHAHHKVAHIRADVQKLTSTVLLDTASATSPISEGFAINNKLSTIQAAPIRVRIGDGPTMLLTNVTALNINFDGRIIAVTAYLAKNCPVNVLIGYNDMAAHRIILDAGRGRAYIYTPTGPTCEIANELPFVETPIVLETAPVRVHATEYVTIPPKSSMAVPVRADGIPQSNSNVLIEPSTLHGHQGWRTKRSFTPVATLAYVPDEAATFAMNVENRHHYAVVIRPGTTRVPWILTLRPLWAQPRPATIDELTSAINNNSLLTLENHELGSEAY